MCEFKHINIPSMDQLDMDLHICVFVPSPPTWTSPNEHQENDSHLYLNFHISAKAQDD